MKGDREDAGIALLDARSTVDGAVRLRQRSVRLVEKAIAGERWLNTRAVTLEQGSVELIFKGSDAPAHGRRPYPELAGSAPAAEIVGGKKRLDNRLQINLA